MKISKTQLEIIEEIYRKTVFEPLETFSPDYVEEANQHQGFICGILFGLGISGKLD